MADLHRLPSPLPEGWEPFRGDRSGRIFVRWVGDDHLSVWRERHIERYGWTIWDRPGNNSKDDRFSTLASAIRAVERAYCNCIIREKS